MISNSGKHRKRRSGGRSRDVKNTAVGKQRHHHITTSTNVGVGPLPHWEGTPPSRSNTEQPTLPTTTTTTVVAPISGKETGGSLHAVHGAMIGCALALILMLTPMLALFGRKALARRRMRQFQSKRGGGNVPGCNDPNNKLCVAQDIVRHHQVVARVESRDVGTTPELIIPTTTQPNNQSQGGFTLIENFAYGDFIGCTAADSTTKPGISLSPPFDGKCEAATTSATKKKSAVDVVYVNLGSNISRNKRRREHAYEMIDSTSAGLQIRDNLHPPKQHIKVGKRHSRDKVTTFPFHPGCSESSDSARLEYGGDHRMIFGSGYSDRRLSGRPLGGTKKNHISLWSGNGAGGSIRYKHQAVTGSIASSFTRGKEEQTTTTMEQLMRDRGGTRVRRKRKLKRRTHDLRRKRAHIRRIAAIKRHQVGVGVVVGKREATILEVEVDNEVAKEHRRISTSSAVSNYSATYGAPDNLPAMDMDNGSGMLSSSSRHSTMDRGYGTGVSLGKFRLPSISEHERNSINTSASNSKLRTQHQQQRRFTVHGALPSSSSRPKNITTATTTGSYDVIKSRSSGNVAQLKAFTRKSKQQHQQQAARKPVLKSKSVPHLNRIEPPPQGNYLKSTSVLDVLGCYMKSKNYNTDYSRSVLRIRDSKLYPAASNIHKQASHLTEDSTCSGGSVVSCPLLGQSVPVKKPLSSLSKPSPLSRQRPRSAMLSGTASKTRIPSKRKRQMSRSLHDVGHDVFMPLDPSTENLSVFMEMSI